MPTTDSPRCYMYISPELWKSHNRFIFVLVVYPKERFETERLLAHYHIFRPCDLYVKKPLKAGIYTM